MAEFKQSKHIFRGMNRDISPAIQEARGTLYFDAQNIRINTVDNETQYCITNEHKPQEAQHNNDVTIRIKGDVYLGHAIIDNNLVVFSKRDNLDFIEKFVFRDNRVIEHYVLYQGHLNFNVNNKIETTCYIQNESEKIVYWVDGINQPRRIDITKSEDFYAGGKENQFDFTISVEDHTFSVDIEKTFNKTSTFKGGTVQYFLTAIGVNKQESGIIYQTALYYPSDKDRATAPDATAKCNFNITIKYFQKESYTVNSGIDKLRLYSVERSSVNTDGYCRIVKTIDYKDITDELETLGDNNNGKIIGYTFEDDGTLGEAFDVKSLLLKQGTAFTAETLAQKDSVLFLGNLTILNNRDFDITDYIDKFKNTSEIGNWDHKLTSIPYTSDTVNTSHYHYSNALNKNSFEIQTFKYGEYYRLGIQLQDKYGNWTSPIYISDVYNDKMSYSGHDDSGDNYRLVTYNLTLDNLLKTSVNGKTLLSYLRENGFIQVRPMVVFPEEHRRNVIAQGVVNPTVFNLGWRKTSETNNTPFAMASWFFRPFYHGTLANEVYQLEQDRQYTWSYTPTGSEVSYGGIFKAISWNQSRSNIGTGMPIPYKHHSKIRGGVSKMGEIQSLNALDNKPPCDTNSEDYNFYVDQSIATLNSPEIDFDDNLFVDSNYKIRLLGIINIQNTVGKTYIEIKPGSGGDIMYGGNTAQYIDSYLSTTTGIHGMVNSPMFVGATSKSTQDSQSRIYYKNESYYITYPFQVTGSLSGVDVNTNVLGRKITANLRYSNSIIFHTNHDNFAPIPITSIDIQLAKNTLTRLKIAYQDGGSIGTKPINYYKDVDYNLSSINVDPNSAPNHSIDNSTAGLRCTSISGNDIYGNLWGVWDTPITLYNKDHLHGYTYFSTATNASDPEGLVNRFSDPYNCFVYLESHLDGETSITTLSPSYEANTLTSICYASNKHIVFSLPVESIYIPSRGTYYFQNILPDDSVLDPFSPGDRAYRTTYCGQGWNGFYDANSWQSTTNTVRCYNNKCWADLAESGNAKDHFEFGSTSPIIQDSWGQGTSGVYQEIVSACISNPAYPRLWLAEVYKEEKDDININSVFPYNSNDEEQKWLIGGKSVALVDVTNSTDRNSKCYKEHEESSGVIINYFISYDGGNKGKQQSVQSYENYYYGLGYDAGDTYYQRYDCLKTYPHEHGTDNNIIDILSFMCESHYNLASRYDNYRGLKDNTVIDETLFNILNSGYTQADNLLTYQNIKNYTNKFVNQVTWSLVKDNSRVIDNWTNLTLANTINVPGDKGEITALKNFKGHIISFQKNSVNEVIYNPNVQINSTDGLPIEIANSLTVNGVRNLFTDSGTANKWSICATENALYFVDDYNNAIYQYQVNQSPLSLTDKFGLRKWAIDNRVINTYFDRYNRDLYFYSSNKQCLTFNETVGNFVSFMDYGYEDSCSIQTMFNINDSFFDISGVSEMNTIKIYQTLKEHNVGEYLPSYIEFIENDFSDYDKVLTSLEVRADVYDTNKEVLHETKPIDSIRIYNEYQDTDTVNLDYKKFGYSNLKKKFRQWNIDVPRDKKGNVSYNRMRNNWFKIRYNMKNNNLIKLYSTITHYYI